MDNSRSVQPISGSIPSKQVSNVFLAQVTISTKSNPLVHVLALLDSGANSCFMDRIFAQVHQISLRKLPCPASVVVIDGRLIASGNIVEESEPVRVVLDILACEISFNLISLLEHPIVLGLPWFELHNPEIDCSTREIRYRQPRESTHQISTILLHQLLEEGRKEPMFVFAVSMKPSSILSLLERINGAIFFTKIDLRGAYNLVRIRRGDEWKTTFCTRYGHFEYTVIPFGLTNAPTIFQHMANDIFPDFLDICLIIYLDDLLVYSKTQEEHDSHVLLVLKRLREHGLYAKLEKCCFDCKEVEFLNYVISSE